MKYPKKLAQLLVLVVAQILAFYIFLYHLASSWATLAFCLILIGGVFLSIKIDQIGEVKDVE